MNKDLLEIINQALDKQGLSARRASILATGTPELIRDMRRGRTPSVARFRALCGVLNLEFYVGPTRFEESTSSHLPDESIAMYNMLEEIISRLPPKASRIKTAEPKRPYKNSATDDVHHIPVPELNTNTDSDSIDGREPVTSHIAFQASWFKEHKLDPQQCLILAMHGKSMEPTLPDCSVVLIDRASCQRRVGRIYAIRNRGKLLIRRLDRANNEWQLTGDHLQRAPVPFPASAEIIGEVKWMSQTFC